MRDVQGRPRQVIAGILLAAGESRRFGRPKLLEPWNGEPLVVRAVRSQLAGGLDPVVVVIQAGPGVGAVLDGLGVETIVNAEPGRGIGYSVRLGVLALAAMTEAALIGVADQPLVDEQVIRQLCQAFRPGTIVVSRYGAHAGNPRIFDRRFFPELAALQGDMGGQAVAAAHPEMIVECPFAERVGSDVDEPEDLRRLVSREPSGDT